MSTPTGYPLPPSDSAKVLIEVVAGLLPGRDPDPKLTRRYAVMANNWPEDPEEQAAVLAEYNGRAQGYAALLMMQPDRLNWVRVDWVWL